MEDGKKHFFNDLLHHSTTSSKAHSTVSSLTSKKSPVTKTSKTPSPVLLDWRSNNQNVDIVSKWEYLLDNDIFTDVVFIVGKHHDRIKCHSLVLKMHSKQFESMLSSGETEFEYATTNPGAFRKMIKYLYTDKIDVTVEDAMEVLLLAKGFHLNTLQRKCGQIVLTGINVNNAALLLTRAEVIGDKQLCVKTQEYIVQHARKVLATDAFKDLSITCLQKLLRTNHSAWNVDEVTILEAVKRWGVAECSRRTIEITGQNLYFVAGQALELVRYEKFTVLQFTTHVVKPQLLPGEMMLKIQTDLIEREAGHVASENLVRPQTTVSSTNDDETSKTTEDDSCSNEMQVEHTSSSIFDEDKYVVGSDGSSAVVHILKRYTCPVAKEWESQEGKYRISISATKPVDLLGVALFGYGGENPKPSEVAIQILSYEEDAVIHESTGQHVLPALGGDFDVMFDSSVHMEEMKWYTIIIGMTGRIYPYGTGGKKNYVIDTGSETVEFNFKNSQGIIGAAHARGQLPKIYFSLT